MPGQLLKVCRKCGEPRSESEYYKASRVCKVCYYEHNKVRRLADPERHRVSVRTWKERHPESYEAMRWKSRFDPETRRRLRYERYFKVFGLSSEQVDALIISHCGKCAICGAQLVGKKEPCVDHCHRTGKIRGLLCNHHNRMVGNFTANELRLGAIYVEDQSI